MSMKGIQRAAEAFAALQKANFDLLELGGKEPATASGQQDIRLGHLMRKAKDAIKSEFNKITSEKIEAGR